MCNEFQNLIQNDVSVTFVLYKSRHAYCYDNTVRNSAYSFIFDSVVSFLCCGARVLLLCYSLDSVNDFLCSVLLFLSARPKR